MAVAPVTLATSVDCDEIMAGGTTPVTISINIGVSEWFVTLMLTILSSSKVTATVIGP